MTRGARGKSPGRHTPLACRFVSSAGLVCVVGGGARNFLVGPVWC